MFSSRLPARLTANALAALVAEARRSERVLIDLTETNPTKVGISYPPELHSSLAHPNAAQYSPDARGLSAARTAVAHDYARRGHRVDPDDLVLTASTSEAYSLLFKLLCDAGDDVLIPQPSYPLFDLLTRLDCVVPTPYRLDYHSGWTIDRASVERSLTSRTRAVLVVSPNNPTGSMLQQDEREWIVNLCASHDVALIVDEVFAEYPLRPKAAATAIVTERRVLTFSLGGLSKCVGLPQMKLGWIVVSGPETQKADALTRLEVIADTYLSVSTPVQVAAAELLHHGALVRGAIATRIAGNLARLRVLVAAHPSITLFEPEGGWSAVIRVPSTMPEEALVLRLVTEAGVLVHPGYFFDFADEAFLIVSLLPEPEVFARGAQEVIEMASGGHA